MNLLHLKYAVEVEKTRSISKAAENLFMGQPNLSRAIKELEDSLGISIFHRTSKGMTVTSQGEEFLAHARQILRQVDEVEEYYRAGRKEKQRFSISVPGAAYLSTAFAEFVRELDPSLPCELRYEEAGSDRTLSRVLRSDYRLGILRYQNRAAPQLQHMLAERGLSSLPLATFHQRVLLSADNPLAQQAELEAAALQTGIEIAHADLYVPLLPTAETPAEEPGTGGRRIIVYERSSRFDLLQTVPDTYMWAPPLPAATLERLHLVQRSCGDPEAQLCQDVLIYRKGYRFTTLDERFIATVKRVKEQLS